MYKRINDYGLIGNLGSSALVGLDGSIDWCCLPHLDSPALFAAILDAEKGGRFSITPSGTFSSRQSYREKTNVLDTVFEATGGRAVLTDFMPFYGSELERPVICRVARGLEGRVSFDMLIEPRFDYARSKVEFRVNDGGLVAYGKGESATLLSTLPLEVKGARGAARFELRPGEEAVFVLCYGDSRLSPSAAGEALEATAQAWRAWAHRCMEKGTCVFGGPWHESVVRSAFVLKLLTHAHTGAVAAAPTASLPESIGGQRNWDYRFSWLRDSSFTVQALHNLGYVREASEFLRWFQGVTARHSDPSEIRIMYGLHGETELDEEELLHLEGYRGSRPVRIGNRAASQRQLDIYGEVMDAALQVIRYGASEDAAFWPFLETLADYVTTVWRKPDSGIWEMRAGPRHFVYSKVMCWVALDRALRICALTGRSGNIERWKSAADEIKRSVVEEGFSEKLGSFVQSFGSETLDASSLLIPLVGFLPFEDPRVKGTIDATMRELADGVFVRRYNGDDGLPGREGAFLLCSFWLTDCLTLSGRADEARELFTGLMEKANHLGLYSEEIDPATGDFLGNFPQAFTHIGFINSALYLGKAAGRRQMGPEPAGLQGSAQE